MSIIICSGGSYINLEQTIKDEIELLKSCNLQLVVFFDGPIRRMKSFVTEDREEQLEEKWVQFFSYCEEGFDIPDDYTFPIPPLCKRQLEETLKLSG